jgi:hypothetical protein
MLVTFASQPSPGRAVNEDLAMAGSHFAFVLDGATAPTGVDSGCRHDVAWYVARLGGELARLLLRSAPAPALPDVLAEAINRVGAQHASTCDLANPASPSSTVSILRETADGIDYLVLADSPLVLRGVDGDVTAVHDNRPDQMLGHTVESVNEHRNVPDGFWVAGTRPEAAHEAVTGNRPAGTIACAGIFSDGASRLAERHGMTWAGLLDLLETDGPARVIARVRAADERVAPGTYRGKRHDDATALLCQF